MKHLSANQNLDHTIQPVLFEELYFRWKFPAKQDGSVESIWVNTYEFYERMYNPYRGNLGHACNNKPVNGKYYHRLYELDESIKLEGMQYPIPVMMNRSEQRLQFFSGMMRVRYAMIHEYTSIDGIVSEENDILFNLQEAMRSSGLRDRIFLKSK